MRGAGGGLLPSTLHTRSARTMHLCVRTHIHIHAQADAHREAPQPRRAVPPASSPRPVPSRPRPAQPDGARAALAGPEPQGHSRPLLPPPAIPRHLQPALCKPCAPCPPLCPPVPPGPPGPPPCPLCPPCPTLDPLCPPCPPLCPLGTPGPPSMPPVPPCPPLGPLGPPVPPCPKARSHRPGQPSGPETLSQGTLSFLPADTGWSRGGGAGAGPDRPGSVRSALSPRLCAHFGNCQFSSLAATRSRRP